MEPAVFDAMQKWAADDLRSLNAEAEFLLRRSLREADRLPAGERTDPESEIEGDAHR